MWPSRNKIYMEDKKSERQTQTEHDKEWSQGLKEKTGPKQWHEKRKTQGWQGKNERDKYIVKKNRNEMPTMRGAERKWKEWKGGDAQQAQGWT